MGFFSGIKKKLKKIAKVALKTAPIWTSFIPGGSIVGTAISRVAAAREKLRAKLPGISGLGKLVGEFRGKAPPGMALQRTAMRSRGEEDEYEVQGVSQAGIRGPVPMRHFGQRITPSSLMGGAQRFASRRTRRPPARRRRVYRRRPKRAMRARRRYGRRRAA